MSTILAANRKAQIVGMERDGTRTVTDALSGQGLKGTVIEKIDTRTGRYVESIVAGPLRQRSGFDGVRAWTTDLSGAVVDVDEGDAKRLAVGRAYRNAGLWWRSDLGSARIVGSGVDIVAGKPCDRVDVTPPGGATFSACFDRASHLLVRLVEPHAFHPVTTSFGGYHRVDGRMEPTSSVSDDGSGAQFAQTRQRLSESTERSTAAVDYSPPARGPDFAINTPSGETTIPFRLSGNHIYADVLINGKGPFTFLFDTGAEDTVSPTTATALGMTVAGATPVGGVGTAVESAGYATGVTLTLGSLVLRDQTVHILPVLDRSSVGFTVDGVIGAELSHRVVARFDYEARTITFVAPDRFVAAGSGTPVRFELYDAIPIVNGIFDGIATRFVVDTGNGGELDLTAPFVSSHGLIARFPAGIHTGNSGGTGGGYRFYVARASGVRLGPVDVRDLVVRMSEQRSGALAASDFGGDVGSGLLRRFAVTFDYGHRIMYLKPNRRPVLDAASYDRSGLTLNARADGLAVVSIVPGSPAAVAGLRMGDVLTAENGKAISSGDLAYVRQRFVTEPAGTDFDLVGKRGVGRFEVRLVTRDLLPAH